MSNRRRVIKRVKNPPYHIIDSLSQYNPKYNSFLRKVWDPKIQMMRKQYFINQMNHVIHRDNGYKFEEYAAVCASGYVSGLNNGWLAGDGAKGNVGLYKWKNNKRFELTDQVSSDFFPQDPIHITKITKKITQFIGDSEVGICKLNRKWLFTHNYDPELDQLELLDIPETYQYAIVIVIEMDQEVLASSPSAWSNISIGLGVLKNGFYCRFSRSIYSYFRVQRYTVWK